MCRKECMLHKKCMFHKECAGKVASLPASCEWEVHTHQEVR